MFHDRRLWAAPTPLPDDVGEAVREIRRCSTWTLCTAWSWGGLVRSGGPKRTGFFYVDVETPHVCDACR